MIEISGIGLLTAFLAGAISFLSPCVLPLVPGYVSYIAGRIPADATVAPGISARLPALGLSLWFVFGFSTVFVLLGAGVTALGQLFLTYRYELNLVGGAVVIAFGLMTLGIWRPTWLLRDLRLHLDLRGGGPSGAYLLGLAFAFGWTPCIGPVLGAILAVSAGSARIAEGITLLATYAAGLGLPFLIAALFTEALSRQLRTVGRAGRGLQIVAGIVMVLMGLAMMTNQLSLLAYWLLDAFPILVSIG